MKTVPVRLLLAGVCAVGVLASVGSAAEEVPAGDLPLPAPSAPVPLSIIVADQEMRSVAGAQVSLSGPVSTAAVTDANGVVWFPAIPDGEYRVETAHPLFAFDAAVCTVHGGGVSPLHLVGRPVVPTVTLAGRILDESGAGVIDVLVTLAGPVNAAVRTTCDGSYGFTGIPVGAYVVRFVREGFAFSPAEKRYQHLQADRTDEQVRARTLLRIPADELNLLETTKRMRARGWGEYRAAGRCLCCDNIRDGDCIIIGNVERTERLLIPQVIDGVRTPPDDSPEAYFGEVAQRGTKKQVSELYAQVDLPAPRVVTRVVVWTVRRDGKPLLSNAEVGYVDRFDRIQWTAARDGNRDREFIELPFPKPVTTKSVLVRVVGGGSRITEIEVYGRTEQ